MSSTDTLSANARKLQEEDIERVVKCRLRSEIEARKAVESTMKRAVQEARELKKELVLLRQEKEELLNEAKKNAVSSPGTRRSEEATAAAAAKAKEKKLHLQIQTLTADNERLNEEHEKLKQDMTRLLEQKSEIVNETNQELIKTQQEMAAMESEMKKLKSNSDEMKRRYQKVLKDKKEEMQKALQENEQLARCTQTLERQLELLPQLKKQLQLSKDKNCGVSDEWQKKLDQRNQAFLRQEEENKHNLLEKAQQIATLEAEKEDLQAQLNDFEAKGRDIEDKYSEKLRKQEQRFEELVVSTKQLQERLLASMEATKAAEKAKVVAEETMAQESRLRQLAEDAADAVEARAEKTKQELEHACQQLAQLEKALKARGITFEYLLKQQGNDNNPTEQEEDDKERRPEVGSRHKAANASGTGVSRRMLVASSNTVKKMPTTTTGIKDLPVKGKPTGTNTKTLNRSSTSVTGLSSAPTDLRTKKTLKSNNEREREETPERMRT